jgi:hypothetical protein
VKNLTYEYSVKVLTNWVDVSVQETSDFMLYNLMMIKNFEHVVVIVTFEVSTAVTMKNVVFWDIKTQFVPHRRHIASPLQNPRGQCYVRFEVFVAVTMKTAVVWNVASCGCCKNLLFGGTYHRHHQGDENWRAGNNVSSN